MDGRSASNESRYGGNATEGIDEERTKGREKKIYGRGGDGLGVDGRANMYRPLATTPEPQSELQTDSDTSSTKPPHAGISGLYFHLLR